MITNPAASQKEPESDDTQEFMRMINDARNNGLSQASGAGFGQVQLLDADDQSNPDQALLDNPHVNAADQMGMAAFDLAVRGAISAKFSVQIQNKQFHDEFSMTGGDGSLKKYFEQMFDEVDENGNKKDDEWGDFVEAHERIKEQRERMEEEWDRTRHNIAGMQMTGAEIDSLSDFMSDPVNRQKLIERRAREKNISLEQAAQDVDKTQEYLDLSKEKHMAALEGRELPAEKLSRINQLEADKNIPEVVQSWQSMRNESTYGVQNTQTLSAQSTEQQQSTDIRANVLDRPFSSAPRMGEAFKQAQASETPLDAQNPAIKPVSLASNNTPSPQVATSGFDI